MEVLQGEFTDDEDEAASRPLPPSAFEKPPDKNDDGIIDQSDEVKSPAKKKGGTLEN